MKVEFSCRQELNFQGFSASRKHEQLVEKEDGKRDGFGKGFGLHFDGLWPPFEFHFGDFGHLFHSILAL